MEKNRDKSLNEIEDVTLAAFLSLRNHTVTPHRKPNGRIAFEVTGDVSQDIQALYLNQKVGILDYIRILKSLRSSIFALKEPRV